MALGLCGDGAGTRPGGERRPAARRAGRSPIAAGLKRSGETRASAPAISPRRPARRRALASRRTIGSPSRQAPPGGPKDAAHACYLRGCRRPGTKAIGRGGRSLQFTEAIRLDPRLAAAFADRAASPREEERAREGHRRLHEAIRLDHGHARAYASRGTRSRRTSSTEALADLSEAIRLDPRDAKAFGNRGGVWIEEEASSTRRSPTTTRRSGSSPKRRAYNIAAGHGCSEAQLDKAIADLTRPSGSTRGMPEIHRAGYGFADEDELDKALADCDVAIRLDPHLAYAHRAGHGLGGEEPGDKASPTWTEAIRLDPRAAEPSCPRGQALRCERRGPTRPSPI